MAAINGIYNSSESNINSYVNVICIDNLPGTITPTLLHGSANLSTYLKSFLSDYYDLAAYLNIIEISDLPVDIYPNLWHGRKYLSAYLKGFKHNSKDFNISLHSWDTSNLLSRINQVYSSNLNARILSTFRKNLQASLQVISPVDFDAFVHGFDYLDLTGFVKAVYGPNDLQSYITAVGSVNLHASLSSYLGLRVTKNLPAVISSYYTFDLQSYLYAGGAKDLPTTIFCGGNFSDLYAILIPKVVHVKKLFFISLLSTRNLSAIINSSCMSTSYIDLSSKLYSYDNRDLSAYISLYGDYGGNLKAEINTGDYMVLDTIDVSYFPDKKYSSIHLTINSEDAGIVFDTIGVKYNYPRNTIIRDLGGTLTGIRTKTAFSNIKAKIFSSRDVPFKKQLKKLNLAVLDLSNYTGKSDWRREVEIFFNAQAKSYQYFDSTKKAYRSNKEKHWIIKVIGFNFSGDLGIERGKVRTKYIFDLRKYKDIDEAIRDAIDRVSFFRRSDLTSTIKGVDSLHPFTNLTGYLFARPISKGTIALFSRIKGYSTNNTSDFSSNVYGQLPLSDLPAVVVGDFYVPPPGNNVDFDFRLKDKVSIIEKDVDLNFDLGV